MAETSKITTRTYQAGETIFHEGDHGSHVYLIISGKVEIVKTADGQRQLLNELGSGEIFGEMGLITKEPRYATVIAAEDTRLIMVNDKTFHNALLNNKLPIIKPLTQQLVLRYKEMEEQNRQNKHKAAVLQQELIDTRERLLECEAALAKR